MGLKDYMTVGGIIAIILLIIGIILLINNLWVNWKINKINSWPKTNATVLTSFAKPAFGNRDNVFIDPNQIVVVTGNGDKYVPHVEYVYHANGQEFASKKVVYGGSRSYDGQTTKDMLSNMTPGSTISVFYNPSNPSESYIYVGDHKYWNSIIGIILIIIALFLGAKTKKKSEIQTMSGQTVAMNRVGTPNLSDKRMYRTKKSGYYMRDFY